MSKLVQTYSRKSLLELRVKYPLSSQETVPLSDEIEFMIDFGESKKLKQLAEIITGLVSIILNAVGMLEERINQLDNEIKSLSRRVNALESKPAITPTATPASPLPQEREADLAPRYEPVTSKAPTVEAKPTAPKPATPPSPASARMQLQSELKALFSKLRRTE